MKYKYRNGVRLGKSAELIGYYFRWKQKRDDKRWRKSGYAYHPMSFIEKIIFDASVLYDGIKKRKTIKGKIEYLRLIHNWHVYGRMNEKDRNEYSKKILESIHESIQKEEKERKEEEARWEKILKLTR
jgi:hypothetical protein